MQIGCSLVTVIGVDSGRLEALRNNCRLFLLHAWVVAHVFAFVGDRWAATCRYRLWSQICLFRILLYEADVHRLTHGVAENEEDHEASHKTGEEYDDTPRIDIGQLVSRVLRIALWCNV